MIELQW